MLCPIERRFFKGGQGDRTLTRTSVLITVFKTDKHASLAALRNTVCGIRTRDFHCERVAT